MLFEYLDPKVTDSGPGDTWTQFSRGTARVYADVKATFKSVQKLGK